MPLFLLKIKCDEMENVAFLAARTDAYWKFDIATSDGADTRSGITLCQHEEYELTGSRGTVLGFQKPFFMIHL
jgi:hypothetical protein